MKTHVFCLGFNTPVMLREAMENFRDTVDCNKSITKTIYDLGYPLPDVKTTRDAIHQLGEEFGWRVAPMENKSVALNWQQAFLEINPTDDDIIIGFDPDCRLEQIGWLPSVTAALRAHPEAPLIIPNRHYRDEEWCYTQHGRHKFICDKTGLTLAKYDQLVAWSMGCHRCDWLRFLLEKEGEFKAYNAIYGYGEHWQADMLKKYGKTWYELCDFYDNHKCSEVVYSQWKIESAQKTTEKRFEEWLSEKT